VQNNNTMDILTGHCPTGTAADSDQHPHSPQQQHLGAGEITRQEVRYQRSHPRGIAPVIGVIARSRVVGGCGGLVGPASAIGAAAIQPGPVAQLVVGLRPVLGSMQGHAWLVGPSMNRAGVKTAVRTAPPGPAAAWEVSPRYWQQDT